MHVYQTSSTASYLFCRYKLTIVNSCVYNYRVPLFCSKEDMKMFSKFLPIGWCEWGSELIAADENVTLLLHANNFWFIQTQCWFLMFVIVEEPSLANE